MIDVSPMDNGVRITLSVLGAYEHLAYESGDSVIVEVKELAAISQEEEDEVKFFEEKTYEGTKVTFNFQDIPVRSVLQLIALFPTSTSWWLTA
jgi:type IV pilus assembly protein PilQ